MKKESVTLSMPLFIGGMILVMALGAGGVLAQSFADYGIDPNAPIVRPTSIDSATDPAATTTTDVTPTSASTPTTQPVVTRQVAATTRKVVATAAPKRTPAPVVSVTKVVQPTRVSGGS